MYTITESLKKNHKMKVKMAHNPNSSHSLLKNTSSYYKIQTKLNLLVGPAGQYSVTCPALPLHSGLRNQSVD